VLQHKGRLNQGAATREKENRRARNTALHAAARNLENMVPDTYHTLNFNPNNYAAEKAKSTLIDKEPHFDTELTCLILSTIKFLTTKKKGKLIWIRRVPANKHIRRQERISLLSHLVITIGGFDLSSHFFCCSACAVYFYYI
jgi:hypothetical protein